MFMTCLRAHICNIRGTLFGAPFTISQSTELNCWPYNMSASYSLSIFHLSTSPLVVVQSQMVNRFFTIFAERMDDAVFSGRLFGAWLGTGAASEAEGPYSHGRLGNIPPSLHDADCDDDGRTQTSIHTTVPPSAVLSRLTSSRRWSGGSSCALLTLFSLRFGRWYQGRRYAGGDFAASCRERENIREARRRE